MQAVCKTLIRLSKCGDLAATKLLLEYTIGAPLPAVDPDAVDLHELRLLRQSLTEHDLSTEHLVPAVAVAIARALLQRGTVSTLMHNIFCTSPGSGPGVRKALEEAGFGDLLQKADVLRERIEAADREFEEREGQQ
jgi:hypothetical protein